LWIEIVSPSRRRSSPLEKIAVIGCGAVADYAAKHLADQVLFDDLMSAAQDGGAQLKVVSGAIGALDALSAAMSVVRESRNSVAPLSIR
jgi:predicted dinucleotide-utilizing enzyme